MCKDREPAQRATGCPASLVGVTRCRTLRGLADSMLPDPGLRVLALGYTLSPAARASRYSGFSLAYSVALPENSISFRKL